MAKFFLILALLALITGEGNGTPLQVLLPGKSNWQRSLVGCSPWGHEESDMTERLHFHFSLSCIGEGNGNPLQCSCLENPRDVGAWWAAVYGVAQSLTQLKRLSSSSSSRLLAWKIPGTGEPGRLPSMGSHRVGHDWSDLAAAAASILAGEFHRQRAWQATAHGVAKGLTRLSD